MDDWERFDELAFTTHEDYDSLDTQEATIYTDICTQVFLEELYGVVARALNER